MEGGATRKILITNERPKPWVLVEQTRFQSDNGIIFRIEEKITVPGATYAMVRDEEGRLTREKVPGTLVVEVKADEEDIEGGIAGERGNITKGTSLVIPALDPTSQKIIYAQAEEDFLGGVTDTYEVLTEEDLETS